MIWVVFAHIGLPVLFAFGLMIFSAASSREGLNWDLAPDVAFEMTILSFGATAAIFENPTVAATYGPHSAIVAMAVVAVDLILGGLVLLMRRYIFYTETTSTKVGSVYVIFGGYGFVCYQFFALV